MTFERRWMHMEDVLALKFTSHGDAARKAHGLLVVAEEKIEEASQAIFEIAMDLKERRLAGAALSAQSPAELRNVLRSLLVQLPVE